MPTSPFTQRHDDRLQAEAECRRSVVNPWRHLPKNLAVDKTVLFHLAELLDQDFLAGIGRKPFQLGEPLGPSKR